MAEMTREQIKALSLEDIARIFAGTWVKEQTHKGITWEDGTDLVNILAHRGQEIAAILRKEVRLNG